MNITATPQNPLHGASNGFASASAKIEFDLSDPKLPRVPARPTVVQTFRGTNVTQTDAPVDYRPIITPRRVRSRLHPEKRAAVRALLLTVLVFLFTGVFIVMQKSGSPTGGQQESPPSFRKGNGIQVEELWRKTRGIH